MESLSEEPWDVVICGTGLQQSLLALALSRSKKRILHLDPNDYYGQREAALSLQEADRFASDHAASAPSASQAKPRDGGFRNATVWKHPEAQANGLAFPRAYSLALAPQIIHTRSQLLSQLVSSRAYRQVEFLAVGSFFVYEGPKNDDAATRLSRIPSSREDVFSSSSIPTKSKRALMKFLKFVVDYDSAEQRERWQAYADLSLSDFLASQFKLDDNLRNHILALTLTLDGKIAVKDGLAALSRHLTSLGFFGAGFCAVYPKWGGLSEVAQVACRAGAVGGGVYMLDTGMTLGPSEPDKITIDLSNGISVQACTLFSSQDTLVDGESISRLVAVVKSPLKSLFEVVIEGTPTPAAVVVAFPSGSIHPLESATNNPVYAMVHSSDTGECPNGQSTIYLTTLASPGSKQVLEKALELLLTSAGEQETPVGLYQLYYEQTASERVPITETLGSVPKFSFPSLPHRLALFDTDLDVVMQAWKVAMGEDAQDSEYMVFEDREGADAHDDGEDTYE